MNIPAFPRGVLIRRIGRCFTATDNGVIEDAAVVVTPTGELAWVGRETDLTMEVVGGAGPEEFDAGGALVTPGFVDAHTHPLYGGNRFAEIAARSAGASYSEIAAAGGGIASTVMATRALGSDVLATNLRARLGEWLAGGTTTVEAKTGYHLDIDGELAAVCLLAAVASDAAASPDTLPDVEVTWLAGHGVGPEWGDDADGYAGAVAAASSDAHTAGARHADVFCDAGYFTVDQSRLMLAASRHAGLIPRIHADELARTGGAELAAELGCASADHLLQLDDAGIRALAEAHVVATLAPITALAMGKRPPARALIDAGVTIALGSDHNPGTCGTTSMSLVVALAIAELGLSVDQALTAATAGGAASLRLDRRGSIAPGSQADLVAWDADHEGAFAWSYALRPTAVWHRGLLVPSSTP